MTELQKKIIISLPKLNYESERKNFIDAVRDITKKALIEKEIGYVHLEYWKEDQLIKSYLVATIRTNKFCSNGLPK